jgi:predicted nucleotidyltransferase component of viral defense system
MQDLYYFNRLYPLQDKTLKIIEGLATDFYLTGGTVLGRHYLHHRYSDDLDFFMNAQPDFHKQVDEVIAALENSFNQPVSAGLKEDTFVRLFISEKDVLLKIDFINDVPFHSGELITSSLFSKTDNIQNILSNKISALSRDESKDIADLLFISRTFSFNWERVINEAKQKDDWVNELDISKRFHEFLVSRFEGLKWIENVDLTKCEQQLKQMAVDVLNGTDNSILA